MAFSGLLRAGGPPVSALTDVPQRHEPAPASRSTGPDADASARAARERWTVPAIGSRPAGGLRLLLFPFAGGGASAFADWQSYFPDSIETYALQYPGRETRWGEPGYATRRDLITAIADDVVPYLKPPFAFLGHSLGGLVAFEVARLLEERRQKLPVHLFVAAIHPPEVPRGTDIHRLPDAEFLAELRAYDGLPPELLDNEEFLNLLLPIIREDIRLSEEPVSDPASSVSVPITVFGGLDDHKTPPDTLMAWASQTSRSFSSHFLPGHHFFLFEQVSQIADRIRRDLQRSLAPP
jgi:surfactin synthase thioesterase subunit